jgi:hypothetical protein
VPRFNLLLTGLLTGSLVGKLISSQELAGVFWSNSYFYAGLFAVGSGYSCSGSEKPMIRLEDASFGGAGKM